MVNKNLMETDTEIATLMDIKTTVTVINLPMVINPTVTDMANNLMDPAVMVNKLMDPAMVTNNRTVKDTVNLAMVMDTTEVITTKDTDTSMTTSISTIPTKRSDTMPKSKMTIATKS